MVEPSKPKMQKEERIVVGGSGTNLPVTRKLAQVFMEQHPGIKVVIPESLGSAGGVKNASDGVIDIGLVSRELLPREVQLGLTYIPYAKVLIVFATHPYMTVDNLTAEQICDIYSGKIQNWRELRGPNQKIVVLTREYNDSSKLKLNECLTGFKDITITPEAIMLRTDQAMNEAIPSIENSIGWTDIGAITSNNMKVKTIKINGIAPSYQEGRLGQYLHYKPLAFVVKGQPNKLGQDFINFAHSAEGARILLENGYIPDTATK